MNYTVQLINELYGTTDEWTIRYNWLIKYGTMFYLSWTQANKHFVIIASIICLNIDVTLWGDRINKNE